MGLIGCVVRRKLQRNWRATPWPLVAVLTATEELAGYKLGFDVLCEALKRYDLPDPVAVSTDYFSGSGGAATGKGVWVGLGSLVGLERFQRRLGLDWLTSGKSGCSRTGCSCFGLQEPCVAT